MPPHSLCHRWPTLEYRVRNCHRLAFRYRQDVCYVASPVHSSSYQYYSKLDTAVECHQLGSCMRDAIRYVFLIITAYDACDISADSVCDSGIPGSATRPSRIPRPVSSTKTSCTWATLQPRDAIPARNGKSGCVLAGYTAR